MKLKSSFQFEISLPQRFSLLWNFFKGFLFLSMVLRIVFMLWQKDEVSWNLITVLRTLATGAFFDSAVAGFAAFPGILYLLLLPNRYSGSLLDKIVVYFFFSLTVLVLVFVFFAEITFWEEFRTRFNFIAVDYLIYTHEVVRNIQESYPLPYLILGVAAITLLIVFLFKKRGIFAATFAGKASVKQKLSLFISAFLILSFYVGFIKNNQAEWSSNRYNNEISKAGIYSFFAEFRNNQMKYTQFYTAIDTKKAFETVRNEIAEPDSRFIKGGTSIRREITDSLPSEARPNVVFILMESMSASFMKEFGNEKGITPNMDKLAQQSLFFTNLYATGTRTVRGMEAVTLCILPTPGQSIVKRPDNQNLYTVSNVFQEKGYQNSFFYGGDGYFDNMNCYFGGNGFTIYDRGRGSVLSDKIKTERHNIEDSEVTFENAWGICDENIYDKMLQVADEHFASKKPFFNFVMTTSNHRPYTYPEGKIDIPSGKNRDGAVKYADYALGQMLEKAKTKPWFKNTVFVIIADHCASSAGKDEIDVANYHIPAFIYNLPAQAPEKVLQQCSQIDLFPTLFAMLRWNYRSNFFGKNALGRTYTERAYVGTYRKLAYMKKNKALILSDQKQQALYDWNKKTNELMPVPMDNAFLEEAISGYQAADYLFTNKLLKE
ncbi:phosphoglycerol transferase MdoB-like AlkP superfamily enzyme [Flavobacterium endophyticum]|uniref:Phosphoglycerol transferase MdoB-like AlkP superfamily enzyme n=1 Tax=Flavobacterium endophyticum TaxID=1540163 RepID=A0A495MMZ6_9FLAO|nr:alkaline phosphatase family protein [Flavobacterium endophyticum]RKS25759.1 phosphoglycerol transferase MdoB-like AlkP superfamily enzyme [Flavobacterium endophyticum]